MTNSPAEIPLQELLDALLDADTPFHPRFLYRLSDLSSGDLGRLADAWPKVPAWRRQALLEDVEALGVKDYLLSFEALGRFALRDSDPKVRLPAVRILWEFEQHDLASIYMDLLENDSDAEVRAVAASGLGKFIYFGEVEEIAETLHQKVEKCLLQSTTGSDSDKVRRKALESLGYSSREEVAPLIESAYSSGDKDWIVSALSAMGRSANEKWEEDVLAMLENQYPAIRAEAARAAGELELSRARRTLLDLLEDPDENVRTHSIWSLSQIGGDRVRAALEKMYQTTDDEGEADYIEQALDNLAFTEDLQLPLLELEEDEVGAGLDEDDEIDDDDYLEEDDEIFDLIEDEEDLEE